jgi:hypothetical protein
MFQAQVYRGKTYILCYIYFFRNKVEMAAAFSPTTIKREGVVAFS